VKKEVQRLVKLAERLELNERKMQVLYGSAVKGSERYTDMLDAKAIRSVLAALEANNVQWEGCKTAGRKWTTFTEK